MIKYIKQGTLNELILPGTDNFGYPSNFNKWILFSSSRSGIDNIYAVNKDTKELFRVQFQNVEGSIFHFEAGQFIILNMEKKVGNESKTIRRSYSIASSPNNKNYLELIVKIIESDMYNDLMVELQDAEQGPVQTEEGLGMIEEQLPEEIPAPVEDSFLTAEEEV